MVTLAWLGVCWFLLSCLVTTIYAAICWRGRQRREARMETAHALAMQSETERMLTISPADLHSLGDRHRVVGDIANPTSRHDAEVH